MRELCFTVDVDRDVNECVPGRRDAVSKGSGNARFTSTEKGADLLLDLLDEIGVKATFFVEARTLMSIDTAFGDNEVAMHGFDHEDMTGEVSRIPLSDGDLDDIMRVSTAVIRDRTARSPKGFRAPYMRINDRVMDALARCGMLYDSSLYADISKEFRPYDIGNGMKEIPVPVGVDDNGKKIFAYLWPMHEGKRSPDEYVRMANMIEDGVFVIATHSWHITESINDGKQDNEYVKKNLDNIKEIITSILDNGFRASRMIDIL